MAHGLDCRLNSFMLMELASFLSRHKKDLKYHVTLLSSSQEEQGWQEPRRIAAGTVPN